MWTTSTLFASRQAPARHAPQEHGLGKFHVLSARALQDFHVLAGAKQIEDGRERVVAGVSCELCHGGARDWLALHNDYGGPSVTKASESAEHQAKRVADSVARGMNNPHNIYLIARQCYDCHTVPNEKLVNVGKHKAGKGCLYIKKLDDVDLSVLEEILAQSVEWTKNTYKS